MQEKWTCWKGYYACEWLDEWNGVILDNGTTSILTNLITMDYEMQYLYSGEKKLNVKENS